MMYNTRRNSKYNSCQSDDISHPEALSGDVNSKASEKMPPLYNLRDISPHHLLGINNSKGKIVPILLIDKVLLYYIIE